MASAGNAGFSLWKSIRSFNVAPNMVGTAKKKENSAAAVRFSFCDIPPTMDEAERDTPGILGVFLKKYIDVWLESPLIIGIAFLVGGIILLFVDEWFNKPTITEEKDITYLTAFKIGCFQCLAMIPGVSRSASSIVGGMSQKLNRTAAAEFSFFLAVPTMFGATLKDLMDFHKENPALPADAIHHDIIYLLLGSAIAFVVALLAIRSFITFLEQKGFKLFGWYRIFAGAIIIILFFSSNVLHNKDPKQTDVKIKAELISNKTVHNKI